MMKTILSERRRAMVSIRWLSLFCCLVCFKAEGQSVFSTGALEIPDTTKNVYVQKLFSEPGSSSFFIGVRRQVKLHKHEHHTEHVYILSGTGEMTLGKQKIQVKPGDFFIIPEGTAHALVVSGNDPVRLISVQSPEFDGKDRIFIEN